MIFWKFNKAKSSRIKIVKVAGWQDEAKTGGMQDLKAYF